MEWYEPTLPSWLCWMCLEGANARGACLSGESRLMAPDLQNCSPMLQWLTENKAGVSLCADFLCMGKQHVSQTIRVSRSCMLHMFQILKSFCAAGLPQTVPVLRPTASKNECPTGSHLTKMTACRSLLCWTGASSLVWADCSISLSDIPCCCGKSISICDACDLCNSLIHTTSLLGGRVGGRLGGTVVFAISIYSTNKNWSKLSVSYTTEETLRLATSQNSCSLLIYDKSRALKNRSTLYWQGVQKH